MTKKKISKKQKSALNVIYDIELDPKKVEALLDFDTKEIFRDPAKVGAALLQCLRDNDTESFMQILDSYLRVNRKRAAKNSKLTRSTVQLAFSKRGNPTLKTIAKIVHHEENFKNR